MRPELTKRKPANQVTPAYEDAGLFKAPPVELQLRLVPKVWQNRREDVVIQGFTGKNAKVDVILAGRRRVIADPLVARLREAWTKANQRARDTGNFPKIEEVQVAIRLSGAWRPRFVKDGDGWQTKEYQFLVAQMWLADAEGIVHTYGEPPVVAPVEDIPDGFEGPDHAATRAAL